MTDLTPAAQQQSPAQPPPLPPRVAAVAEYPSAHAPPARINYSRFQRNSGDWAFIASFGTPDVWHDAQSLLSRHDIVSRMADDPPSGDADKQRMGLEVLVSEAEWARDILSRGIPELAGLVPPTAGLPGSAPASTASIPPLVPSFDRWHAPPLPAMPVGPGTKLPSGPASAGYVLSIIFLFALLAFVLILILLACFIPE